MYYNITIVCLVDLQIKFQYRCWIQHQKVGLSVQNVMQYLTFDFRLPNIDLIVNGNPKILSTHLMC